MDFTSDLDTRKYVMSVDTFDLALLPEIYTPSIKLDTTHLWNANKLKLNPNEYYKFEVKPKTDANVRNGDVTSLNTDDQCEQQVNQSISSVPREDIVTTTCHICDIEIPAAYLVDHEDSLKHKAHLKITEVVLDRTKKHMLKKATIHKKNTEFKYFCGPCACEVEVVSKHNHEKSKGHKQSVSLDRLLCELVALFANEENESEESRSVTNGQLNENVNDVNELNLNTETEKNIENIDNNTVLVSDIKARLDEFEMKTMENYINMINECDKEKTYMASEHNELRISVPEDYEVIVSMDNFNGFMRIDKNLILCIVCKMIVENENDHKISDTHIKNIVAPFDRQCLRNLDNSSSHCVICNKIFTNADFHVLFDETHNELLQKSLVHREYEPSERLQKAFIVKENKIGRQIETDSQDCNGYVTESDDHNEINKTETKSNESKPDVAETNKHKENGSKNCNRSVASDYNNEIEKTSPNFDESIPDIVEINNEMYYCRRCNIEMHINNVSSHIKGTKHAMNCKSHLHYQMKAVVGSTSLVCRVCNVYVSDNINKIAKHISTSEHTNKYKELLSSNYVIQCKEKCYCKPCDIYFLKINELCHIEKLNHAVKLNLHKESLFGVPTDNQNTTRNGNLVNDLVHLYKTMTEVHNVAQNTHVNERGGHVSTDSKETIPVVYTDNKETEIKDSIGNNSIYLKKTTTEVKAIQITNINEPVGNISTDLKEIKPEVSTNNEIPEINDSGSNNCATNPKTTTEVKNIPPVNRYYCNICNVYIPNNPLNISGHNDGAKHKKKELTANAEIAESIESQDSSSDSLDGYYHQMSGTDNEKNLMCRVCRVVVPYLDESVVEHIQGKRHDSNFKIILNANHIDLVGDLYYCNYCKVHVKTQNIYEHINEMGHKKRMKPERETTEAIKAPNSVPKAIIREEEQNSDTINTNESKDSLYMKYKHHFREMADKSWLYCLICTNTNVLNTAEDVAKHTSEQTHLNGYKDLMYDNFIFETNDQLYFCAICVCLVPLKGEVHHARGLRHTKNYENTTKEEKCNLCDVDISGKIMIDHINSKQHFKEIIKKQSLLHFCEFCNGLMQKSKVEEHLKTCHKFAVKNEICFCTTCDPYLPGTH